MTGIQGKPDATACALEALMLDLAAAGRVCLQPQPWQRLWEMLPDKQNREGRWSPSLPLILDGWWHSSDAEKSARFRVHVNWAAQHGAADEVLAFLRSLAPSDWYTQS